MKRAGVTKVCWVFLFFLFVLIGKQNFILPASKLTDGEKNEPTMELEYQYPERKTAQINERAAYKYRLKFNLYASVNLKRRGSGCCSKSSFSGEAQHGAIMSGVSVSTIGNRRGVALMFPPRSVSSQPSGYYGLEAYRVYGDTDYEQCEAFAFS